MSNNIIYQTSNTNDFGLNYVTISGTVKGGKTAALLDIIRYFKRLFEKKVRVFKSTVDVEKNGLTIKSRNSNSCEAEKALSNETKFEELGINNGDIVCIDEAQFVPFDIIKKLYDLHKKKLIRVFFSFIETSYMLTEFESVKKIKELIKEDKEKYFTEVKCEFCSIMEAKYNVLSVNDKASINFDPRALQKYIVHCNSFYPACEECAFKFKKEYDAKHKTIDAEQLTDEILRVDTAKSTKESDEALNK